jgi:hypothetical protein
MLKDLFASKEGGVKPWVTYAILAIAVIVGGYFLYNAWAGTDRPLPAVWLCANPNCGYTERRVIEPGAESPQECPKCHQKTLWIAFRCHKCGNPLIWNENRGLPPPTKCPKCGEENRHGA